MPRELSRRDAGGSVWAPEKYITTEVFNPEQRDTEQCDQRDWTSCHWGVSGEAQTAWIDRWRKVYVYKTT